MVSDFVKGRKKFDYPPEIQAGITLHRLIDQFTDLHPATREAKEIFRPAYRLYSGAFIDVVYDHFLARDQTEFSNGLMKFSENTYRVLEEYRSWLPAKFAIMLHYMKTQNWLYNYQYREGTAKSFGGLVRRAAYLEESQTATRLFNEHYQLLESSFRQFWTDIKPYAKQQLDVLLRSV